MFSSYLEQKLILGYEPLKVNEAHQRPLFHRSLCAIRCLNKYHQRIIGTGILISKNLVLSCAHIIYDTLKCQEYHDIKIYVGGGGGVNNMNQCYEVQNIRYMQEYKICEGKGRSAYDFALLKLTKQVQFQEFLQISLPCQICLMKDNKSTYLNIFGFPSQHTSSSHSKFINNNEFNLYGLALNNRIIEINTIKNKIYYGISTLPGQSGCPVVVGQQIIAIHLGANQNKDEKVGQCNIGRFIDLQLINKLQNWCKQLNGHPFSIYDKHLCTHLRLIVEEYLNILNFHKAKQISKQTQLNKANIIQQIIPKGKQRKKLQKVLSLPNLELKQIIIKDEIQLTQLWFQKNHLQTIDVTNNTKLTHLWLPNNNISTIDITNNTHLIKVSLAYNQLKQINITKNTKLTELWLQNNHLPVIDASKNINLADLWVPNNQLSAIDITNCTNLTRLSASHNKLYGINVSKNNKLTHLYIQDNNISSIDINSNIRLIDLWLASNNLSSINMVNNINLVRFSISNNRIYAIDTTNNINLTHLYLYDNILETIDVTKNNKLIQLSLFNNKLTNIYILLSPQRPTSDYLSDNFNFFHQYSDLCKVLIKYQYANEIKYNQLKEGWQKKYRNQEYRWKFVFVGVRH